MALGTAGVRRVGYGLQVGCSGRGMLCRHAHSLLSLAVTINAAGYNEVHKIRTYKFRIDKQFLCLTP